MQIWIFLKQKRIYIFLRCRFEFFFLNQKQICIFLRCRSEFFSNKKWICIFIRCRSEFFSNQKLICIFLSYRSDFFFFFLTYADFEIKKKIKHDCVCGCLFNACCINLYYEWNSLLKKYFSIFLKHIKQIWYFSNQRLCFM